MEKNCMYLLYEQKQSLETALDSLPKLVGMNKTFLKVLTDGVKKYKDISNDLSVIIQKTNEEIEGYQNQKLVLEEKLQITSNIIKIYEKGNKPDATETEKTYARAISESVGSIALALGILKTDKEIEIEKKKEEDARKEQEKERKRVAQEKAKNVQANPNVA